MRMRKTEGAKMTALMKYTCHVQFFLIQGRDYPIDEINHLISVYKKHIRYLLKKKKFSLESL